MNDFTIVQLRPRASDRILEIGFGGGDLIQKVLSGDPTLKVSGIDLSSEMVSSGAKRFKHEITTGRLDLTVGAIERLPYPDASFDRVCTVNTIYFWSDPRVALSECLRVMKPNGSLVICLNAKEELEKWSGHRNGFHLYETLEIEGLLRETGFARIETLSARDPGQGIVHCVRASS